jgi:uncharacterized protein
VIKTAAVAFVLAATGCATTPPTRFYVLRPLASPPSGEAPRETGASLIVGVGPIDIPEYLDRPQIVTRGAEGAMVSLGEFDRWAEPLVDGMARVLRENLSALLSAERVSVLRSNEAGKMDFRVSIEVVRLDAAVTKAVFEARWSIKNGAGATVVPVSRFAIATPMAEKTYEAAVLAESQALDAFSRELAEALRRLLK